MKKKTKQQIFDRYYKAITGKDVMKDIHTKPDCKTGVPENIVKLDCMKWLIRNGILARRNNVGVGSIAGDGRIYQYGIKHAGDLICCLPGGKYCEIECKHGNGGTWSVGQQKHAQKVKAHGGHYFVVHSVGELVKYINPLLPIGGFDL